MTGRYRVGTEEHLARDLGVVSNGGEEPSHLDFAFGELGMWIVRRLAQDA